MNAPNDHTNPDLNAAMDRLFDRELSREDREALSARLNADPDALRTFRETTNALLELRAPIDTPDVTAAVLARLNTRPGFTTRRSRRLITAGRLAFAAALLGAGAGVIFLEQYPQAYSGASPRAGAAHQPLDPAIPATNTDAPGLARTGTPGRDPLSAPPSLIVRPLNLDMTALEVWSGAGGSPGLTPAAPPPSFLLSDTRAGELVFDPSTLIEPWSPAPLGIAAPWGRFINFDSGSNALYVPGLEFTIPAPDPNAPVADGPATDGS